MVWPPGSSLVKASVRRRIRRTMLKPVDYSDVVLLDGPMREQFRAQHATLLALDEDALLKPFRSAAGLPAPGTT